MVLQCRAINGNIKYIVYSSTRDCSVRLLLHMQHDCLLIGHAYLHDCFIREILLEYTTVCKTDITALDGGYYTCSNKGRVNVSVRTHPLIPCSRMRNTCHFSVGCQTDRCAFFKCTNSELQLNELWQNLRL